MLYIRTLQGGKCLKLLFKWSNKQVELQVMIVQKWKKSREDLNDMFCARSRNEPPVCAVPPTASSEEEPLLLVTERGFPLKLRTYSWLVTIRCPPPSGPPHPRLSLRLGESFLLWGAEEERGRTCAPSSSSPLLGLWSCCGWKVVLSPPPFPPYRRSKELLLVSPSLSEPLSSFSSPASSVRSAARSGFGAHGWSGGILEEEEEEEEMGGGEVPPPAPPPPADPVRPSAGFESFPQSHQSSL